MNEEDLNYLKECAARRAQQFSLEATVTYDSRDGFMTVEVIKSAGGGEPISIRMSVKFHDRAQAEAFIEDIIRLGQRAGAPR